MRLSAIASTLLFVSVSLAQNDLGTINGKITDPDGGNVAGVIVQAKHATGRLFKTESVRTGDFTLSRLPAGSYEVLVPLTGFRFDSYSKKDLTVQAGRTVKNDIRLQWSNQGVEGDDQCIGEIDGIDASHGGWQAGKQQVQRKRRPKDSK